MTLSWTRVQIVERFLHWNGRHLLAVKHISNCRNVEIFSRCFYFLLSLQLSELKNRDFFFPPLFHVWRVVYGMPNSKKTWAVAFIAMIYAMAKVSKDEVHIVLKKNFLSCFKNGRQILSIWCIEVNVCREGFSMSSPLPALHIHIWRGIVQMRVHNK